MWRSRGRVLHGRDVADASKQLMSTQLLVTSLKLANTGGARGQLSCRLPPKDLPSPGTKYLGFDPGRYDGYRYCVLLTFADLFLGAEIPRHTNNFNIFWS